MTIKTSNVYYTYYSYLLERLQRKVKYYSGVIIKNRSPSTWLFSCTYFFEFLLAICLKSPSKFRFFRKLYSQAKWTVKIFSVEFISKFHLFHHYISVPCFNMYKKYTVNVPLSKNIWISNVELYFSSCNIIFILILSCTFFICYYIIF